MSLISALYPGWVMHRRLRPKVHRFKYRVFSMLIDLDELPALTQRLRFFSWNRAGLFSFHDRDHGDGRDLRAWSNDVLARAGLTADGPRRILCYPRILGFVFNPLSVWFCHGADGTLRAVIYEVHNTFNERHAYALPVTGGDIIRHGCAKDFYVSPFLSPDCHYDFRVRPPADHVAIAIQESEHGAATLNASFSGQRAPLTDRGLLRMLFSYPLMTLKVVAGIHFEAVRLFIKGVRHHPHRPAPSHIQGR